MFSNKYKIHIINIQNQKIKKMKKLYSLDECQLDELASIRGGEAPDRFTYDDYIGVIGSVGSDG